MFNILISNSTNSYIALLPPRKLHSTESVKKIALDAMALAAGDLTGDDENKVVDYFENVSRQDADAHIRGRAKKLLWRFNKS